jgi:putative DNA primase/helicase
MAIKGQVHVANGDDGSLWAHSRGIWTPQPKLVQDALTLTLKNAYKTTMVNEVTHHVESRSPQMVVGPTPDVINFTNGMLHWQTGELGEHDPNQFSTIQLPHDWNPDAECPMFDQFLEESLEPETVRLAWEAVAVAVYSGNPIQRAILLHGLPGSGKSVFLDVIAGLLGQENVSRVTLQGLSGRFNAAELYGRAANICADIDATKISETGAFKMIVAGDTVQGERKNKDPFTFKPFATQFFSANEIPGSEDRSGAWTRRFAIIHFPRARKADEKVLSYQDVLLSEAEGIIAKAVRILPEVLLQGDYSLIQKDQEDFERKTNYLLQFVEDELEPGDLTDETCFVPTGEVRNRYNLWTAEEGYDHPATWKKVTETLTAKGFKATLKRFGGGGPVRGWAGFRLRPRASVSNAYEPYDDGH